MLSANLVSANVEAPQFVEFSSGDVTFPVRCELLNKAAEDVVAFAGPSDAILFWHVLNDQNREIARKPPADMGDSIGVTVATAHPSHDAFEVSVPASKLKDGKIYTLRVVTHGVGAETKFTAVKMAGAAAPARKKKAAKKKARS